MATASRARLEQQHLVEIPRQPKGGRRYDELHRATWRSADMLYRLRLVDKNPTTGRTFRTGKVGDPKKLAENARKPVVRYKINDESLQANALSTAWQVLTE